VNIILRDMKPKTFSTPYCKLPPKIDLTLFLIREELKSQKLFNGLHKAGIDDCYFQTRLGKAILANIGLDDESDEVSEFYYKLIEKRSKKIEADSESTMTQAFKVYVELVTEKKRRKIG
jgi:hypothetical protein